jgi:hypothetical protein
MVKYTKLLPKFINTRCRHMYYHYHILRKQFVKNLIMYSGSHLAGTYIHKQTNPLRKYTSMKILLPEWYSRVGVIGPWTKKNTVTLNYSSFLSIRIIHIIFWLQWSYMYKIARCTVYTWIHQIKTFIAKIFPNWNWLCVKDIESCL